MAPAATVRRLSSGWAGGRLPLLLGGAVGGCVCVLVSVALATGRFVGGGPKAVGVALFLLVTLWCFAHRRVDQTIVALALYLGLLDGYAKLSTGSGSVTLARDVLVIAIAAGALVRSGAASKRRDAVPPLTGFVVAFIVVVLVELANPSARGGLTTSLAGARQHLEFVPLFFLGYAFLQSKSQVRAALFVLVFCAAVGGVVSYVQSTLTPDQLAAWGPGYAERILGTGDFAGAARVAFGTSNSVRPFGLGSEVGAGAIVAALAIPGMLALLMVPRGRGKWAVALMAVGVALAVATSGSRSALITVFVSLLSFGVIAAASKNGIKAVLGIGLGFLVIYTAFTQLGPSNSSTERAKSIAPTKALTTFTHERGGSVTQFGTLASQHPLGVGLATAGPASGFERTPEQAAGFNAETQWNFLILEVGIAGVVIYVAFLLRLMWLGMTRIRHIVDGELRLYVAALAAPIFSLLIAGFSGPTTVTVPQAPFFWLVSGMLAYWLVTAYRGGIVARASSNDDPSVQA